jgi:ABC-type dipeptide/oligopeptide/nickel transport system permease component
MRDFLLHLGILRFILRRSAYLVLQLLGVVTVTFFLVRLIPGNPAEALAGVGASPQAIAGIERSLGLDKPLPVQYWIYLQNLARGDLGNSIFTGQPVLRDLEQRVPATGELLFFAILIIATVGTALGIYSATRRGGIVSKVVTGYGMLTGSIPDFWLGLVLVFIFFYLLRWAPPPLGRFDPLQVPPTGTGFYVFDSIVSGNMSALITALRFLTLPVITLVLVYMGNVVKQTRVSMEDVERSEFIEFARACGLPGGVVLRYKLRNAIAPTVTVLAFTVGYLLGGAVLVETVFSWGGLGQYAVQSIANADYAALTGIVGVVAVLMSLIFLVLDIVYAVLDPRIWRHVQ